MFLRASHPTFLLQLIGRFLERYFDTHVETDHIAFESTDHFHAVRLVLDRQKSFIDPTVNAAFQFLWNAYEASSRPLSISAEDRLQKLWIFRDGTVVPEYHQAGFDA